MVVSHLKQNDLDAPVAMMAVVCSRWSTRLERWSYGFVPPSKSPTVPPNKDCFLIDLETGRGYMNATLAPVLHTGLYKHLRTFLLCAPWSLMPRRIWKVQQVATGLGLYDYTQRVGGHQTYPGRPTQSLVDPVKVYVSGYMYPQVFDRVTSLCSSIWWFRLTGEVRKKTGWFPTFPWM